jgi:hypothetical protein
MRREVGRPWTRSASSRARPREACTSYDAYDCAHSICGAHLVRDCAGVAQQEHQEWASEMQNFLLDLHDAYQEWRLLHLTAVPAIERDEWVARYARDSACWLCRSTATTRVFRRIAARLTSQARF